MDSVKRILFSIPNFHTAGSKYVLLSLFHGAKKRGFEPFVVYNGHPTITPPDLAQEELVYIEKYNYPNLLKGLKYTFQVIRALHKHKISVFHSWDYKSEPWEALACRLAGVKFVYTKKNSAWSKKWYLKSILAHHIVYDNPVMKKQYFSRPLINKKITFIPHGVDIVQFSPDSVAHPPKNNFIIGCVGNIGENKNQLFLIKSLLNLPSYFVLHLYGNGDLDYLQKLHYFIRENNLTDRVKFGGYVNNTELPKIIKRFDVFALVSKREGLPVSILEAMACGVPCIATHSGGGTEFIIDDGENGYLLTGDDMESMVNILKKLSSDSSNYQRIVKNALDKVRSQFSLESEIENNVAVYNKMIGNG